MSFSQKNTSGNISSKFQVITPFLGKVTVEKLFENFQQIYYISYAAFINSIVIFSLFLLMSTKKFGESNFHDCLYMQ